jgi:hypothetical protein
MTAARVLDLRCEHLVDPLVLGVSRPRLSWRTETDAEGWEQSAYQVEVVDADTGEVLWDSGLPVICSNPLPIPPLTSRPQPLSSDRRCPRDLIRDQCVPFCVPLWRKVRVVSLPS